MITLRSGASNWTVIHHQDGSIETLEPVGACISCGVGWYRPLAWICATCGDVR